MKISKSILNSVRRLCALLVCGPLVSYSSAAPQGAGEGIPTLSELPDQTARGAKRSVAVQEVQPRPSVAVQLRIQAHAFPRGSVAKKMGKPASGHAVILSEKQVTDLLEMRGVALSQPGRTLAAHTISTISGREALIEQGNGRSQLRVSVVPLVLDRVTHLVVDASLTGDEFGNQGKQRRCAKAAAQIKPGDVMVLSFDESAEDVLLLVRSVSLLSPSRHP